MRPTRRVKTGYALAAAAIAVVCLAAVPAPSYHGGVSYESQLLFQVERVSKKFSRLLERAIFSEGFVHVDARAALKRMVGWLNGNNGNKYQRMSEFLDLLNREDVQTLFDVFKSGYPVGSDELLPVIEAPEAAGQSTPLILPFHDVFFVIQGNGGGISHFKGTENEYAWDFVVMKDGFISEGSTHKNEHYHAWGLPALAPAAGTVLKMENGMPDHIPMTTKMGGANFVHIRHENNEVSAIYHFMKGSVAVNPGGGVERGAEIAKVGDSGISMFPHIHYQLERGRAEKRPAVPAKFACYFARGDIEGKWRLVISGAPRDKEYVINCDDYVRLKPRD